MASATANPVRDEILYSAIRKIGGGVSFEATVAALPPDFDLDEAEYSTAMKILNMAPGPVEDVTTSIEAGPDVTTSIEPHPPETKFSNVSEATMAPSEAIQRTGGLPIDPPMTNQQASDAVLAAENKLGEARMKLRHRQAETKAARATLATSITIWQTGLPAYTQEHLVRDHLKASQEARRKRVEQGGAPNSAAPPGKSVIDRQAKYGRDNSPEGAARSRMQNGARRGAFGISAKFQNNFDPARGAVAKLPSER
jgi:hypothetical protein